jgi:hypothetical protein
MFVCISGGKASRGNLARLLFCPEQLRVVIFSNPALKASLARSVLENEKESAIDGVVGLTPRLVVREASRFALSSKNSQTETVRLPGRGEARPYLIGCYRRSSTIFPVCSPLSINRWASTTSEKGNVL